MEIDLTKYNKFVEDHVRGSPLGDLENAIYGAMFFPERRLTRKIRAITYTILSSVATAMIVYKINQKYNQTLNK